MSKTQPARGMRDFLPAEIRKRNYVINIIKEVYESYGFEPLETPAVENLETLTGKYGEEGNQLIYKILKRGEKLEQSRSEKDLSDLALRYDLTVPLARVVAQHRNDLPKFFKRYQIQPVWRADRPARGRYREFYQCDVDAIGSSSMIVEAELCAAVSEILTRLGFEDFRINLNHRNLLCGILESVDIPISQHADVLSAFDKFDKIGAEGVGNELAQRKIPGGILKFLDLTDSLWKNGLKVFEQIEELNSALEKYNETTLERLAGFITTNENGVKGTTELEAILKLTKNTSAFGHIYLNPQLARGLSYYTGAIMEIELLDDEFKGSLGGGGRYDELIGMFGKEQIPACGFSLGLERILVVMEDRGMFPKELSDSSAEVLVTIWNENSIGESLKLASELRKENLRVLVYPEADKLGKQFKYADSIGIETAIILRDEEIAENKVKVKNLQTGEEETFSREEIASKIIAAKNTVETKN